MMGQKRLIAMQIMGLIIASVLTCSIGIAPGFAQGAPPSLGEQLKAEYQLAKVGSGSNGPAVLEPGTVLAIQKDGIFGVSYASTAICRSRYRDGKVDSPDVLCPARAKGNSRPFKAGEKVYPSQIRVDLRNDQISFGIVACDSCNGTNPPTSFKSEVVFQFAKGYLAKASVPEVEDTIGEVFAVSNTAAQAPPSAPSEAEEAGSNVLTNDMVIKMAGVKLGDGVILDKIKTSQCSFDTSTDALIKLKQAGVSDAVLQAMIAAGAPAPAAEPAPAQPAEASASEAPAGQPAPPPPDCNEYNKCVSNGDTLLTCDNCQPQALADFQAASSMDPSKPDAWAGIGIVYLSWGRDQDAVAMWDKALALGGTLAFRVWHFAGFHQDRGVFRLSAKEASFTGSSGEKIFSSTPADVSPVKAPRVIPRGWSFRMKVDTRNYNFSFMPVGAGCRLPSYCNDPVGYEQERAVANYIAETIGRLASGSPTK
jgi:hypothetical protein